MPLFWTDSIALCCSNIATVKKWWMDSFDCKQARIPADWDCVLPSDVALTLPGHDRPTILLSNWEEVRGAGYQRSNDHPIIFCHKLEKAKEHLQRRGLAASAIQQGSGTEFFEVHDPEGNSIEICIEP